MAWSIVGVGTVVEATATAITLTEPAGVADGDLLIACFASRTTATTAVTNTGWTAVNSQNNSNTSATAGSAIGSGTMLYQVRAGTPDLSFVVPAGISVIRGQIVAYRGNATTTPLDVSTAGTTGAVTAVSVTGLTTTAADDLIVAMAAGGQEATWASFNATTPAGASGATDTTTAPSATWRERAESVTTTGADTSLGIFDAVKTAAGATGNLTVTASIASGHVVIAGAFKIGPPATADAWNTYDKTATVTLSASDKTATLSIAGTAGIRSTTTQLNGTAGKWYAELLLFSSGSRPSSGLSPISTAVTASGTTSIYVAPGAGTITINGTGAGSLGSVASGDTVCIAWDTGAEQIWFRRNGDDWNATAGHDPATGVGGLDASSASASAYALWMLSTVSGAGVTLRTELAEFTQTVPSGFASWMGETPSAADAWNINDKSANITLSNNDKTATSTSATAAGIRSTTTQTNGTAGKYYAEFFVNTFISQYSVGIKSQSAADLTSISIEVLYIAVSNGNVILNGTIIGNIGSGALSSDVICIAWDAGTEKIWCRKNGGLWNNDASANPATGTNGFDLSTHPSSAFCLWFRSAASGNVTTLRTELAEFTQAVPAGFTSWMGEALGPTAYTLPAVAGTYALTGAAASLEKSRFVTSDAGAYALTGADATLTKAGGAVTIQGTFHPDTTYPPGSGWTKLDNTDQTAATTIYLSAFDNGGLYKKDELLSMLIDGWVLTLQQNDDPLRWRSYTITGTPVLNLPDELDFTIPVTYLDGGSDLGAYQFYTLSSAEAELAIAALPGSYALTGATADLELGREVLAVAGSYALTGTAASLEYGREVTAVSASYALTGVAASLELGREVLALGGSYALTGAVASLKYGREVAAVAGSYALTGADATLTKSAGLVHRTLPAVAGSYALAGTAASLELGREVLALAGAYAVSGATASLEYGREVVAVAGAYALTGTAASLEYGREVGAIPGSYALTGTAATFRRAWKAIAVSGSYTVTGTPANLLRVGAKAIIGLPGSYALTGAAASLEYGREVLALGGSYALTGTATSLEKGREIAADAGSYALTGAAASLERGREIAAVGGSYALAGLPANLLKPGAYAIAALPGSYALTGAAATLTKSELLAAGLISVWNGSAWVDKPAKVWTGSAWAQKPIKHWNGSAWV